MRLLSTKLGWPTSQTNSGKLIVKHFKSLGSKFGYLKAIGLKCTPRPCTGDSNYCNIVTKQREVTLAKKTISDQCF